jgi:hypothetical protein
VGSGKVSFAGARVVVYEHDEFNVTCVQREMAREQFCGSGPTALRYCVDRAVSFTPRD